MPDITSSLPQKLSPLTKFGLYFAAGVVLLGIAGYISVSAIVDEEKPFYTPGVVPSRESCFLEKISRFRNINKQILFQAAQECELEIQSIEGHEQARLEWLERKAEALRNAKPAEAPPPPTVEEPKDRLRRVWR